MVVLETVVVVGTEAVAIDMGQVAAGYGIVAHPGCPDSTRQRPSLCYRECLFRVLVLYMGCVGLIEIVECRLQ